MIRIHVICEGQTEEMFVNEIISENFSSRNIHFYPTLIGKPGHKGGNFRFERLLTDVRMRLLGDPKAYCTTFFDFYGLPPDFPGKQEAQRKIGSIEKAECVTQALTQQLEYRLGEEPLRRFIPYVQMHEFEGLLFSDTNGLAQGINRTDLASEFHTIRTQFDSPEEINDNPQTAPSKRIRDLFTEYDKPLHGSLAALEIGVNTIREECQLFNRWLARIENLT